MVVEVIDVNDWEPRFRQPYYKFSLPPVTPETEKIYNETINLPMVVGKIEAADGDVNDKITFSLKGSHASMFTVDSRGVIWLKEPITNLKHSDKSINLLAMATDSGQRSSSVPVTLIMDPNHPAINKTSSIPGILGVASAIVLIIVFMLILITIFVYKR